MVRFGRSSGGGLGSKRSGRQLTAVLGLLIALSAMPTRTQEITAAQAARSPSEPAVVLSRYCTTCHSQNQKAGGLVLAGLDIDNLGSHAATWERVVRKLGAGAMPPAGVPRPDADGYQALLSHLESSLDDLAEAAPNPGRTETFRRLNRTEYQNAIRDLFDVDADLAALLPADDSSHGFDNVTVSGLSPTLLERYLAAAGRVSRLAVGTPVNAPGERTFIIPADLTQEGYIDGQIFGTRAGTTVRHTFPNDGEYEFRLRLTRDRNEHIEGLADAHQLDISIDGVRARLFSLTPTRFVRVPLGVPNDAPVREDADAGLVLRAPVKAGAHEVQVAFVKRSAALIETVAQPFLARFSERHPRTQPALHSISISGPYNPTGVGETTSRRRIFRCYPTRPEQEAGCAQVILTAFGRRAYRRPLTAEESGALRSFYDQGRADRTFEHGIEMALRALLVSPPFLFRVEQDPAGIAPDQTYALSDLELASRLSFFLWSSIPDDELLQLAARRRLAEPEVLARQVKRMLADPRSEALVTNFAAQWLYLRNLPGHVPDPRLFLDFDDNLRRDFQRETELFFQSIIAEDRSVLDTLRANFSFLNERLAKHYGIAGVYGSHFRRVEFDAGSARGGLLGQGSILTVTSYPDRTSPVRRGRWILENLTGTPVPPPPNDLVIPPLRSKNDAGQTLSMRERMVTHRKNPVCAGCHALMDPVGLSLENFDAVGRWRSRNEGGTAVDASGGLPGGRVFDGANGLREAVLARPELFVSTLTEKLLTFALGRGLEYYDAPAVRAIARETRTGDYRFSAIVTNIVLSTPFRYRRSQS